MSVDKTVYAWSYCSTQPHGAGVKVAHCVGINVFNNREEAVGAAFMEWQKDCPAESGEWGRPDILVVRQERA